MKTRIIYDGTNPENPESMLYLKVIEVENVTEIPEVVDGMIPYLNLMDHPDLDLALATPLATLTIDYSNDVKELLARVPKAIRAHYEDEAGDIDEDDKYILCIQTIYVELMKVTGAEAINWPYF